MKRYLISLALLLFVLNTAFAQSASSIIDKLIKNGVITAKQRPILETELKKQSNISYKAAILSGLEYISLKKTFHVDPHKTGVYYYYHNDASGRNRKQDSTNRSLTALLNKIKQAGLLSSRIYNYARQDIDSNKMFADVQLYGELAKVTYRLELLAPDKLLPIADQLHRGGVLGDSSLIRLKQDIKDYKIESMEQLAGYCEHVRQYDLNRYKGEPAGWMEQVMHDIAATLPNVNISNFTYTTAPDTTSPSDLNEILTRISFVCNGRTYRHHGSAMILKNKKGEVMPEKLQVLDMLGVFNTILADQQSPLRLHTIMFEPTGLDDNVLWHFSLVTLNEEQEKILSDAPCRSYMLFSSANYNNQMNSAMVDSVVTLYTKAGLFAHLSNEQIKRSAQDVEVQDLYNIDILLSNFPGVIYQASGHTMIDPTNIYADMVKNLGPISHGAFSPTAVSQKLTKNSVTISYTSAGKQYHHMIPLVNGWPKTGFSPLLKQIAAENNLPGQFYNVSFGNAIIYLTPQQYNYVVAHKLLDLGSWN